MSEKYELILTPEFRLSFPVLKEAKAFEDKGEPKFSITMIFPKSADISEIKRAVGDALRKKWPKVTTPEDVAKMRIRNPILDGDERVTDWGEAYENSVFIRAITTIRPDTLDRYREPLDPDAFYAGCYCRAVVHAFAYETKGNRGVSISLDGIQFVRDGEPLGNRAAVKELFPGEEKPSDAPKKAADLF